MFSRDPTGSALAAKSLNPPESLAAATPAVIPTFPHVLAAPLVAIFSPLAAARTLVAAPPAAFWATFVMLCLAHALAYTFVLLSIEMFQSDGVFRSPLFAWRDLNGGNRLGPVEAVFAAGLVVVPVWITLTSWLFVSRTLRCGPYFTAFSRSMRAQTSVVGFSMLLTAALAATALHAAPVRGAWFVQVVRVYVEPEFVLLLGALLVAACVVRRVELAAGAIEDCEAPPLLPPRCEGCGYDLTHPPGEGICTECGSDVAASLTPGVRRPGCDWENNRPHSAADWLRTTIAILLQPRSFYAALVMNTDLVAARRFAVMHLRYIGCGAVVWLAGLWSLERLSRAVGISEVWTFPVQSLFVVLAIAALALGTPLGRFARARAGAMAYFVLPLVLAILLANYTTLIGRRYVNEIYMISAVILFLAPLVCWLGHRLGGAIVSSIAMFFRFLPDYRWAEKVILYESVVLWLYCTAWGVFLTSFVLFGDWMRQSPLFQWLWDAFGIMPEPFAVLVVTVGISLLWARRYLIAFRAVRWANF